jgi:hypothetical protein
MSTIWRATRVGGTLGLGVFFFVGWFVVANRPETPTPPPSSSTVAVSAPPLVTSPPIPPTPVDKLLGSFRTKFKSGEKDGRVVNIELGAEKIRGSVLAPGAIWSFNAIVGPRTKEKGFEAAPTLIMGEVFQDVGGGMCQVSSTTFAAALKSGLEVVKRYAHSRPSSYVPLGFDAAVNYPEQCWTRKQDPNVCFDLKLRNGRKTRSKMISR